MPPTSASYPYGVLVVCAVLLTGLTIPVTALRLLPAYEMHARFLVFYTPFVCGSILAYLFYVRDSLARLLFAEILNPPTTRDRYYRPSASESLGPLFRRLRIGLLAVLPAGLLVTSFYCAIRYTSRLQESMEIAAALGTGALPREEEVGMAPGDSTEPGATVPLRESDRHQDTAIAAGTAFAEKDPRRGVATRIASLPARERILLSARIDEIPLFTELTVLYIGIFASALTALTVMALKEYAQEAMGLSEQDLMLGTWNPAREVADESEVDPID